MPSNLRQPNCTHLLTSPFPRKCTHREFVVPYFFRVTSFSFPSPFDISPSPQDCITERKSKPQKPNLSNWQFPYFRKYYYILSCPVDYVLHNFTYFPPSQVLKKIEKGDENSKKIQNPILPLVLTVSFLPQILYLRIINEKPDFIYG